MKELLINKKLLLIGITVLVSGFTLMTIGSDTYSFFKLTLSPLIILTGYGLIVGAIFNQAKGKDV